MLNPTYRVPGDTHVKLLVTEGELGLTLVTACLAVGQHHYLLTDQSNM